MQPYIFPYIGYFQLVNYVDVFVFYDDVNFIKRGWVNRNQILVNSKSNLFSVPLVKASQNKMINETKLEKNIKWLEQFYSTLKFNYNKAPYFEQTFDLITNIFKNPHITISDLAIDSIQEISNYLGISTVFENSSDKYSQTKGMDKADRLIKISQLCGATEYINPLGGLELYDKVYFKRKGVKLFFMKSEFLAYQQNSKSFIEGLSIIDVLMHNSKEEVLKMLNLYKLI